MEESDTGYDTCMRGRGGGGLWKDQAAPQTGVAEGRCTGKAPEVTEPVSQVDLVDTGRGTHQHFTSQCGGRGTPLGEERGHNGS